MEKICEMVRESHQLMHLDISNMLLQEKTLDIIKAVKRSSSLISVHLGGNELTEDIEQ